MKYIFSVLLFGLISFTAAGQHLGIKTNLLYDATATINLGLEVGLGKRVSIDVSGNYNDWSFSDDKQWKHWLVQPELRVWLCEKFNGHFFGIHAIGGQYNFNKVHVSFIPYSDSEDYNYRGDFYGGGLSWGYQWMMGKRWGFEITVGGGYQFVTSNVYSDPDSDVLLDSGDEDHWGLTKAGISITYYIF